MLMPNTCENVKCIPMKYLVHNFGMESQINNYSRIELSPFDIVDNNNIVHIKQL